MSQPQQVRSFAGFELNLDRVCLLRDGGEVKLRPKSYETLKYLVENPGRLVTKAELIQAVWPDSFVTDDSLVQCMHDIRRALGDDSRRCIKTVPRRGYIFEPEIGVAESAPTKSVYSESTESVKVVIEHTTDFPDKDSTRALPGIGATARDWTINWKVLAGILMVITTGTFIWYTRSRSNNAKVIGAPLSNIKSIAVLPFKPLNTDENDKYLGLAMADTLITRLSGLGGIIVRPTSSVQQYTSPEQDSLGAGREQRVDAVLEGSIQRLGDKMRVTVRLLSVLDGSPIWADKYDERRTEIFAVQDAISEKVATALELKLTSEDRKRMSKRYTENLEAYQFYIRGVFLRSQLTEEGLKKSIECFQKAIQLDPNYALAYAGQASSNSPLAYMNFISVKEAEARNRPLIAKALELDDTLAEAHAALGEFRLFIDWDWEGAEQEFKRALELRANEQLTHLLYPDLLLIKGRPDEALAMSKAALEQDPFSARAGKALAHTYYFAGQYDQALEQSLKTLELFPNYHMIHLGPIYKQKGMYDKAVDGYLEMEARSGVAAAEIAALRHAYAVSGWRGFWQKRLELMNASAKQQPLPLIYQAEIYTQVGDKDQALESLEKAYNKHDMSLVFLSADPSWESLRADPRFTKLLQRVGLN
ncbi:MAG TPA: winged helix-turn-helix domain-containing protein [Pyrinomonadaceae bacterium]|jgi:TolB-like protein/DNA-binding winged helix-turn-helix (wHTH) protein|nr:winged helix-turn-helix domain-containing protein [Pyrinomonadaceae bacterium]